MFSPQLGKLVKIWFVTLGTLALPAGSPSAAVLLNFNELPNEGGIHLTGTEANGTPIDVTLAGSEKFRVSAPGCVNIAGCNPNFTTNQIGIQNAEFLVNILENAGGPLSDQVHVHRITDAAGSLVIDFISDGSPFDTAGPGAVVSTVVETGSLQSVLTYTSDAGQQVSIGVLSEVSEAVPEPGTFALLGLGAVVLALLQRKPS